MGGVGVCVSVVLFFFFFTSIYSCCIISKKADICREQAVASTCLGIHHCMHALRYISWTLLQWNGRCPVLLEPLSLVKSVWKDLHLHGDVMNGRLQGVSEEFDLSSFSEVRPLKIIYSTARVTAGKFWEGSPPQIRHDPCFLGLE